ncbi:MAG TPA: acyl-CoA dehydrogenase [Acidimicrobiia bacterium]|nr:acyl-CoA dehydrogenase [Acidimicrobiia bacterium]
MAAEYRPPLEDIDFTLNHVAELGSLSKLDGFQHLDPDTVAGVIAEAGRFFAEVMAPLNRVGDEQGSVLDDEGDVRTPDGFRQAYAKYVEAGWGGAHVAEEHGGGGLPYTVGIVIQEMFKTANMALSLCPLLTQAAIEALIQHGTDRQRADYLEKLVTGEWAGTMCLTEPHAGSDVGALSTRAERQDDGTYRLTGTKIFITWGDQDLTDNIIHLVLARTPDSPPGTKGISLFIVPKYILDDAGGPGERNDTKIVSLEHKLGIHASPTCVVSFGDSGAGATGYLIGEEQEGMRYMFTMMNTARIGVGVEGLAITERAYQQAAAYALERRQGREIGSSVTESSLIVRHPDVRRMLMTLRAYRETLRALIYATARFVDEERSGETPEDRQAASDMVALLTPVTKAWPTDIGVEMASLGIQVHGGMGFVEETGAAQYYRDIRIAPIYEGTNGIQAIDLVMRKLPMAGGAVVQRLTGMMHPVAERLSDDEELSRFGLHLEDGIEAVEEATAVLIGRVDQSPNDALAGATPYLRLLGTVVGGWLMGKAALAARRLLDQGEGDADFLRAKLTTARFYGEQLLPPAIALVEAIEADADLLFAIPDGAFG